jgi:hypothetical protein
MNASARFEVSFIRRLALVAVAIVAIAAVALATSSLPMSAATPTANSRYAKLPSNATRMVVHVNRGLNARTDRFSTYATTNAATIGAIIERVNSLPKALSSEEMCPMDVGAKLTLSFYRHAARPYAIVVADPGGCGPVSIRAYNTNDALEGSATVGGGAAFSAYVATQLHIKSLQVL